MAENTMPFTPGQGMQAIFGAAAKRMLDYRMSMREQAKKMELEQSRQEGNLAAINAQGDNELRAIRERMALDSQNAIKLKMEESKIARDDFEMRLMSAAGMSAFLRGQFPLSNPNTVNDAIKMWRGLVDEQMTKTHEAKPSDFLPQVLDAFDFSPDPKMVQAQHGGGSAGKTYSYADANNFFRASTNQFDWGTTNEADKDLLMKAWMDLSNAQGSPASVTQSIAKYNKDHKESYSTLWSFPRSSGGAAALEAKNDIKDQLKRQYQAEIDAFAAGTYGARITPQQNTTFWNKVAQASYSHQISQEFRDAFGDSDLDYAAATGQAMWEISTDLLSKAGNLGIPPWVHNSSDPPGEKFIDPKAANEQVAKFALEHQKNTLAMQALFPLDQQLSIDDFCQKLIAATAGSWGTGDMGEILRRALYVKQPMPTGRQQQTQAGMLTYPSSKY